MAGRTRKAWLRPHPTRGPACCPAQHACGEQQSRKSACLPMQTFTTQRRPHESTPTAVSSTSHTSNAVGRNRRLMAAQVQPALPCQYRGWQETHQHQAGVGRSEVPSHVKPQWKGYRPARWSIQSPASCLQTPMVSSTQMPWPNRYWAGACINLNTLTPARRMAGGGRTCPPPPQHHRHRRGIPHQAHASQVCQPLLPVQHPVAKFSGVCMTAFVGTW